jgi:hypothetical protein
LADRETKPKFNIVYATGDSDKVIASQELSRKRKLKRIIYALRDREILIAILRTQRKRCVQIAQAPQLVDARVALVDRGQAVHDGLHL